MFKYIMCIHYIYIYYIHIKYIQSLFSTHLFMNNFHSICWLKWDKRLQSFLTKGSSGGSLWLPHPEISDHERTLFGEAVHPNLQGDRCSQLSQERDVGRGFQVETSDGVVNSNCERTFL